MCIRDREYGPDALLLKKGSRIDAAGAAVAAGAGFTHLPVRRRARDVYKRQAQDAVALKDALDKGEIKSALVIGASWVGIKVVEDMVAYGVPCTLVDGAKWMFYAVSYTHLDVYKRQVLPTA